MRSPKDYIFLVLKGMGMGAADVIPGVSGGTIAFITEIYEELLNSIKRVDAKAFKLLFSFKFKEFWEYVNGSFLLAVLSGIILSILLFARVIHFLLENYPIELWSFFFGLVLISAIWIFNKTKDWDYKVVLAVVVGLLTAYFITEASPATTPNSMPFVFASGVIAICAMILPGISGAFILLILGKYEYILGAVKDGDLQVIIIFALGCVVGLLSFARLVSWFFKEYPNVTVALLAGFMLGSLNKLWPWKQTIEYRTNSKGESVPFLQENILPTEYLEKTGSDPHIFTAVLFFALGILLVVGLEKWAIYMKESKKYA